MDEADVKTTEKIQSLSDLELAVLVCLVADQHCIIETEKELIRDVQEELKLVSILMRCFIGNANGLRLQGASSG